MRSGSALRIAGGLMLVVIAMGSYGYWRDYKSLRESEIIIESGLPIDMDGQRSSSSELAGRPRSPSVKRAPRECDCPIKSWTGKEKLAQGLYEEDIIDCSLANWRIHRDITPWRPLPISPAFLNSTLNTNFNNFLVPLWFRLTYLVTVVNNTVCLLYIGGDVNPYPKSYGERFKAMLKRVTELLTLPDVTFFANLHDVPMVMKPLRTMILSGVKSDAHSDIVMPHPYSFDPYAGSHGSLVSKKRVHLISLVAHRGSKELVLCPPFCKRIDKLFYQGDCSGVGSDGKAFGALHPRIKVLNIARERPDLLHATMTHDCHGDVTGVYANLTNKPLLPLEHGCRYKYVLMTGGFGAPVWSASVFRMGSAVFKTASPHYEHYYHALRPWVHYIPVDENLGNLVQRIRWARQHPREAERIARNGRKFVLRHLSTGSVACYWWKLLTEISSMLTFKSRHFEKCEMAS
jgi:hypothetical protein